MSKGLAPALSRSGLAQGPQHVDAIEFLAEFASDGLQQACFDEAERSVEAAAGGLFGRDPRDDGFVPKVFGTPEQLAEYEFPQALAMATVVDKDLVFHGRGPPLAGVVGRKGAPTDHFTLDFDDQGRVGRGTGAQPGQPALVGFLRQVPGAGAGPDVVVVDGVDRPDIGREGGSDAWFHGDNHSWGETLNKHRKSR